MDTKQAHALKVGDRVRWTNWTPEKDEAQFGTVTARIADGYGFTVKWDDGMELDYRCVHAESLARVEG